MKEFFSLQVEDVVLVDPGRQNQQRDPVNRLTLWLVLDELDQLVAVDHFAWREREVAPRCEGLGVHDAQPALLEVVHQVAHSFRKARAARLDRPAQGDRI